VASLLAFLQLIPRLIDLAIRIGEQIRVHRFDEWLNDIDETVKRLEAAKSPEEKRNAAVEVCRIIAGRRPRS
jgi:truncated hemoglobin YjbI